LSLFCLFLLCWTFLTDAPPSHKYVGWKNKKKKNARSPRVLYSVIE
jgi:hypothetical protein